jgi:uncharacterized protein (TIGR02246 family)
VTLKADPTAERALQAALDEFNSAWAARDLEGLLSLFAEDDDVVLLGSDQRETARGREELSRLLRYFFEQPIAYWWEWDRREVFAVDQLAWVVTEGIIVEAGPHEELRVPYRFTGVLQEREGRWVWVLFHGSVPDETEVDFDTIVRGS